MQIECRRIQTPSATIFHHISKLEGRIKCSTDRDTNDMEINTPTQAAKKEAKRRQEEEMLKVVLHTSFFVFGH